MCQWVNIGDIQKTHTTLEPNIYCILKMKKITVKEKKHKFGTIHLELAVANLGLISDPFFRGFD